ncbi:EAL domain-containing protein [Actinacidiphila oryziradicis]|uniref:putative bifunctional diguanylate cyclase/phosphodiesterase n=1 Tax=Actinacidiphila oryziradicis TaxID=2571141 RepID=UPI0023EF8308|nr:EAL domain-containing protein [Actinacidiphila oryziradicis]MCW2870151.1 Sensory box or family protein [Actinacidiphila oryziradicis]
MNSGPDDRIRRFATVWSRAIHPVTATSMTCPEFEEYLLPLARLLSEALTADPFDPRLAAEVGAALVAAHCTEPEALPRVLEVVDDCLVPYCTPEGRPPVPDSRTRCARLQHWIAAGFTRALRTRVLAEQEDISRAALAARTEAQAALHESEARFRAVFEGAPVGIGIADMNGRVLDVNAALTRMFGGVEDQPRPRHTNEWVHPDDAPHVRELQAELARGERDHYSVEKSYPRPDGTVLWTNLTVSLLRDSAGTPQYMLGVVEDVTEGRLLHERLRHEATHDALTGLPNRSLFFERLEHALAPGTSTTRVGLCYLDLDGFTAVNDSLGHSVGDRLLVTVAERLRACVTSEDEMVARIGGDEFGALITDPAGRADVTGLADRILAALSSPVRLDGRELSVRCSIGIVEGPVGSLGPAEVLRSADITMYRAKEAGGNRFALADPDSDARAITRHGLTNRLPTALERGEFFVEYQPLVRLSDGSVRGAEALVRWLHPVHGVLGPDHFIPLAESTGLIVPLGRWVLVQAARQARAWQLPRDDGPPVRVNVNLSPCQLEQPGLVTDFVAVLEEAGIEPTAICLELTETALVGAGEEALRPLRQFAELGVDIALDDFGTGYSNLAALRRLPVTTLKLDRSFTHGMQHRPVDPVDLKIVEGIVSLAHTLGMSVTVEGVETGTQAEHLRGLGCDTAQGWYYARPGPPERLHALSLVDAT